MIPFLVADRPISLTIIKGIALPPDALIGIMGQASGTSQRFQELFQKYPVSVSEIYPRGQPPDRRLEQQTVKMVDSGIFGKSGCMMTYNELFEAYERMGAKYGVMIDVFKDSEATLQSAKEAIRKYRQCSRTFELVGVAQGEQLDEYLHCYEKLLKLGFTNIAIGGLLKRRENTVRYVNVRHEGLLEQVLSAIRKQFDPQWLFVLGAFHPKPIALFQEYRVWGSDYKGWIFNYAKKDMIIDLIRLGRLQSNCRVALRNLRVRDVRKLTEQELRFLLIRSFVEKNVIEPLYGSGDKEAKS